MFALQPASLFQVSCLGIHSQDPASVSIRQSTLLHSGLACYENYMKYTEGSGTHASSQRNPDNTRQFPNKQIENFVPRRIVLTRDSRGEPENWSLGQLGRGNCFVAGVWAPKTPTGSPRILSAIIRWRSVRPMASHGLQKQLPYLLKASPVPVSRDYMGADSSWSGANRAQSTFCDRLYRSNQAAKRKEIDLAGIQGMSRGFAYKKRRTAFRLFHFL